MYSSCLSYLNPASNRTIIVQRNYEGNCECEEQSVLQLISITVMKLSLLSTSEFNASFSLRICPSLLLLIVSVVGLSPSASHSSSEWWSCLHSPRTASQCCLFPDLVFWHSHPNLLIFSRSASREELRCILVSKELISIYEQEDNFSKPKQDECRLCPKDENIF